MLQGPSCLVFTLPFRVTCPSYGRSELQLSTPWSLLLCTLRPPALRNHLLHTVHWTEPLCSCTGLLLSRRHLCLSRSPCLLKVLPHPLHATCLWEAAAHTHWKSQYCIRFFLRWASEWRKLVDTADIVGFQGWPHMPQYWISVRYCNGDEKKIILFLLWRPSCLTWHSQSLNKK